MNNIHVKKWDKESEPSAAVMKELLQEEGFEHIFSHSDPAGAFYNNHKHDYIEVRWVLKGEVTFGVNGKQYTLKPGDRLDMPKQTVHNARMHPTKGATYICASK